jgi:menaquinone-dependent protoporphyrinogen oxidase
MVGDELEKNGFDVDVIDARQVAGVEPYDAVVVGGALYAARWHRAARRVVRRHRRALSQRPVWLFSSGPLDDSAAAQELPPVRHARRAMERIGARGHMTFGGRLRADAKGFPASAMAREQAGDWRDSDHVAHWVKEIAEDLHAG